MGYNSGQSYYPTPQSPMATPVAFSPSSPYGPPSSTPTWGYASHGSPHSQVDRNTTYPPPILPSIHSFGRSASVSSSPAGEPWNADPEPTYRPWNADSSSFGASEQYGHSPGDPALKGAGAGSPDTRDAWDHQGGSRYAHEGSYSPAPSTPQQYDPALYAAAAPPYAQPQQPYFPQPANPSASGTGSYPQNAAAPMPGPRSAYTRTLVGPLSSNGYRLLDEHRKPGIFFLFQDLSVRTEGACVFCRP